MAKKATNKKMKKSLDNLKEFFKLIDKSDETITDDLYKKYYQKSLKQPKKD